MSTSTPATASIDNVPVRRRTLDVDRQVGARIRQRRIMLGLTQHQMAELIGITHQQAHKYEKGINRVSASRLYAIAQVLEVGVEYFFEGLWSERPVDPAPQQGLLVDRARNVTSVPSERYREALCELARALAEPGAVTSVGEEVTLGAA
jgi:transcriptional regulator with XRE-family HTH domain